MKFEPAFLPGTLDMLVLKTVSRGAMHGYSIAQYIQQASREVLRVEEGALDPALHRLEVRGWLKAEWGTSEKQSPREVLPADGARPPRARQRSRVLGTRRHRSHACDADGVGRETLTGGQEARSVWLIWPLKYRTSPDLLISC